MKKIPWMVSLHGGHSGEFCDHATGTLREVVEAAIAAGFHTYGISEHAPRTQRRFLYAEEVEQGWSVSTLETFFDAYAAELAALSLEFSDQITLLRGFEAEVVPKDAYVKETARWRQRMDAEFVVGSVHFVDEIQIDGPIDEFESAIASSGGLVSLATRYYETVKEMIVQLRPNVVGHFDLIKKNGTRFGAVDTPEVREAAGAALAAAKEHGCILDLNTAGYRKGLGCPYPAQWVVEIAERLGLSFCFGDDSHGPHQVGLDIEEGRRYLLSEGVGHIAYLTRGERGALVTERASLR